MQDFGRIYPILLIGFVFGINRSIQILSLLCKRVSDRHTKPQLVINDNFYVFCPVCDSISFLQWKTIAKHTTDLMETKNLAEDLARSSKTHF